jgi:RimJ/RimL family protein N-acetyltransferase
MKADSVFKPKPVTLRGQFVDLEPLSEYHLEGLFHLGKEADIWTYLSGTPFVKMEDAELWFRKALDGQGKSGDVPFAVVDKHSGLVAGTTRYVDIRGPHRGIEIGSTWYGQPYRRTVVNTEAKFLLLNHAFEELGALRVQFQTDSRNVRSQTAIERLGAIREGVLRQNKVCTDGYVRDSVVYGITAMEWSTVKTKLQSLIASVA